MAGKMLLPLLGGAPAAWNTCMVFFQAALLAGYAYAHATTSWLGRWPQLALHLTVALLALTALPLRLDADPVGRFSVTDAPTLWLLARLVITLGLPFFVLSATAPLLQRWLSRSAHPAARDPYFLYALSNLGSLLALLSYPVLIEPRWSVGQQSRLWSAGYVAFVALVGLCGVWSTSHATPTVASPSDAAGAIDRRRRLRWLALAFVPSSHLLGVTAFLSNEIAAVPLLWVVPLALYLVTFVVVFAPGYRRFHRPAARALPALVLFVL